MKKIKFFAFDNWNKFGWALIGFIAIAVITSAGNKVMAISENLRLGREAYNRNIVQDSTLSNQEKRLQDMEKVSLVIIEKIDAQGKRLDDIYKILLTK